MATTRVMLQYVGERPVSFGPHSHARPRTVCHGDSVEVDARAASSLLASASFVEVCVARDLKGRALDAALRDAGLSTAGKAAEKRARLAAHTETVDQPEQVVVTNTGPAQTGDNAEEGDDE